MRDIADGLLFEVEMLDDGSREARKPSTYSLENLRSFVVE